jgi:hypothetical protein
MLRYVPSSGSLIAFAFLGTFCCCAVLLAQISGDRFFEQPSIPGKWKERVSETESAAQAVRLREGMLLNNALGHFEAPADGPVFVDAAGRRLAGLENLNLQRITRHLRAADTAADIQWKISGTVTEYEGRNFILIERAVYLPPRS